MTPMMLEPELQSDAVLLPFLLAEDEPTSSRAVEELICEYAQPIIGGIIRNKLRVGQSTDRDLTNEEADDLISEVMLKLVGRLRELRADSSARPIKNFRGYVAVTAYHACDEHLRKKYPKRHTGQARFHELIDKQTLLAGPGLKTPELLASLFNQSGGPLELDELVSAVAELWQITDEPLSSISIEDRGAAHVQHHHSHLQLDAKMDQRRQLEKLWAEICALPLRQRVALLLSLRDANGRGMLTLLPLIGIASVRQIAEILAMPAEKLSTLWNELPVEDAIIAASLGVTRQQVINLRKCARARLWRRTRNAE